MGRADQIKLAIVADYKSKLATAPTVNAARQVVANAMALKTSLNPDRAREIVDNVIDAYERELIANLNEQYRHDIAKDLIHKIEEKRKGHQEDR